MELSKKNISKTLEKINISGSDDNIVSSGVIKNIQVFGDQVDIDLSLTTSRILDGLSLNPSESIIVRGTLIFFREPDKCFRLLIMNSILQLASL